MLWLGETHVKTTGAGRTAGEGRRYSARESASAPGGDRRGWFAGAAWRRRRSVSVAIPVRRSRRVPLDTRRTGSMAA
jgi:hypothetical protein